jgi:MFS family permease
MSIAIGTIVQSVSAYLSLYAVDYFGATEATAAILMAISPAVGFFAAPLGGHLSDRIGGVPVLVAVGFLAIPLIYLLGVVPSVPALAGVMVVMGVIMYTRMPTSEAYIVGHTPERRRSIILGLYFSATLEFSGLLAPVIGNLIDRFGFYWSFTIASIALAAVTIVCSLFLWRVRGLGEEMG